MTRKRSIRLSEAADRYVQDGADALGDRKFSAVLSRIVERYLQLTEIGIPALTEQELLELHSVISNSSRWDLYAMFSLPTILKSYPNGKELADKILAMSAVELVALVESIERGRYES